MKKSIEMPIVNVVRFEAKDVITTSGQLADGNKSGGDPTVVTKSPKYAEVKGAQISDPTRFVW